MASVKLKAVMLGCAKVPITPKIARHNIYETIVLTTTDVPNHPPGPQMKVPRARRVLVVSDFRAVLAKNTQLVRSACNVGVCFCLEQNFAVVVHVENIELASYEILHVEDTEVLRRAAWNRHQIHAPDSRRCQLEDIAFARHGRHAAGVK